MPKELNRREALTALGSVSLGALLVACGRGGSGDQATAVPTTRGASTTVSPTTTAGADVAALFDDGARCTLTREMAEGPFYFDVDRIRSDIREDREGSRLRLALRVRDAESCEPLPNAVVDIWHCDAVGNYSGFESASMGRPGGGERTDDETYLRGAQVSNDDGIVQFVTIYPGWYGGRTVHIHTKVHLDNSTLVTTQLFFDDDFTSGVYRNEPYASDRGRDAFNTNDGIFDESLVLTTSQDGEGYLGVITFDVRPA